MSTPFSSRGRRAGSVPQGTRGWEEVSEDGQAERRSMQEALLKEAGIRSAMQAAGALAGCWKTESGQAAQKVPDARYSEILWKEAYFGSTLTDEG